MKSPLALPATAVILGLGVLSTLAAPRVRTEVTFPDIPGYTTLRCDFHLHTVFSDGTVWPSVRVEEAWRNGLDVLAFTDHIEYVPHRADIPTNHGRAYQLARGSAEGLGLLPVPAAEITRGEPPGHWNALFVTNVHQLEQTNHFVAVENANLQGGFVFWNHPGWKQPEKKSVWYAEQEEVYAKGWLHGIEIVNGDDYDPIAHQWCIEKKLTIMGTSDAHNPIHFDYSGEPDDTRPMTLVFAKDKSLASVREALKARRTAVFSKGVLYGEAEYLEPLFRGSIEIVNPKISIRGKGRAIVQIRNRGPMTLELRLNPKLPELDVTGTLLLPPGKVSPLEVRCVSDRVTGDQTVGLPCRVLNMVPAPKKALSTVLAIPVSFLPAR